MEPDLLQDDPTRTRMRQVFGAIAQYEKTMIVMKFRGARNRRKAKPVEGSDDWVSPDITGPYTSLGRHYRPWPPH